MRHMRFVHKIDNPEEMLNMSIGPKDEECATVGEEKKKGQNLKTTPRKMPQMRLKEGKTVKHTSGLHITASDAKNELIPVNSKEKGSKEVTRQKADGPRKPT